MRDLVRGSTSRSDSLRAVRATRRRELTLVVEGRVRLRGTGGGDFQLSEAVRDVDSPRGEVDVQRAEPLDHPQEDGLHSYSVAPSGEKRV
jgi:hypothetical protein